MNASAAVNNMDAGAMAPDNTILLRAALDALPDIAAVLDAHGVIVMTNSAWRYYAVTNNNQPETPGDDPHSAWRYYAVTNNNLPETPSVDPHIGVNYLEVALQGHPQDDSAKRAVQGIREVLAGRMEAFCLTYPCHTPDMRLWFTMTVTPLVWKDAPGVLITHTDTTPRHRLERREQRPFTLQ